MTNKKKLIQFRDDCIGCNSCVENAPENWEIDPEDGKANLKNSIKKNNAFVAEISEPEIEANKRVVEDCPMGIIQLTE